MTVLLNSEGVIVLAVSQYSVADHKTGMKSFTDNIRRPL